MDEFYNNIIIKKSFNILKALRKNYSFILIGGWAIYFHTRALKSKDIDIVVDYKTLSLLKENFEVLKNERLKKYEIKANGIDIDIYLPFYSNIGFPLEDIEKYVVSIEGFKIPIPEVLLVLKSYAFLQRKGTIKGRKDIIDIFSLFSKDKIDFEKFNDIIKKYKLKELKTFLKKEIQEFKEEIKELGVSKFLISKLKKKILKNL